MNRFLSLKYYFAPLPDPNFQFTKATLALGLILLIIGFASAYYRKKKLKDPIAKKILRPYPNKLKVYGLIILFLLACREEGIPYLSMRLWWFVTLAFFIYTFGKLAFSYKKKYQQKQGHQKIKTKVDKYLPKKKK